MPYDSTKLHRRSIRLRGYDYAWPGAYFVTICTQDRQCLFGEVHDGVMRPNDAGHMVERWWHELSNKFAEARLDAFVVMPNHVHGILIVGADRRVRPEDIGQTHRSAPTRDTPTLGDVMRWFKTMTTNEYLRNIKARGWPGVRRTVWQRNYYEHVVRGETDLDRVRRYIQTNPRTWAEDTENPSVVLSRGARIAS